MKKIFFSVIGLVAFSTYGQQSFSALRTSYFGGVHTVLNNPANIVGNARTWDVNLFSVDGNFGNDTFGVTPNLLNDIHKYTVLDASNPILKEPVNAGLNFDVLAPSAFIQFGKNAIGITTRARVFADIKHIDARILENFLDNGRSIDFTKPEVKINDQSVLLNGFSEIGLSYARVLFQNADHTIKVGGTIKMVQGIATVYAGFNDFSGTATLNQQNNDLYLNINGTGHFELANGGVSYDKFKASDLTKGNASAVGFDLGVVYEYRQGECPTCSGKDPYIFKVGVSVTDIGSIKYDANNESYRYTINNASVNLNNLSEAELRKAFPTSLSLKGQTIKSSLPTSLNINADYRVIGGFYVDVTGQFNLAKKNLYNATYANEVILTPRIENKAFGAYLPFSYNELTKTNIGAAFRVGPLFFGSKSILSNVLSKNAKELSAYAGFRFGI